MPAFIIRRLLQAIVVMIVVALIAFMLFQYVGDPVVFCSDKMPIRLKSPRCAAIWVWTDRFSFSLDIS